MARDVYPPSVEDMVKNAELASDWSRVYEVGGWKDPHVQVYKGSLPDEGFERYFEVRRALTLNPFRRRYDIREFSPGYSDTGNTSENDLTRGEARLIKKLFESVKEKVDEASLAVGV